MLGTPPVGGLARSWLAWRLRQTGLFDPYAYASGAGLTELSEDSLIRHYLARRATGPTSPQPHFDAESYRALAGLADDASPFLHFALLGAHRSDGLYPGFNAETYLVENPDVRLAGWEATRHYL